MIKNKWFRIICLVIIIGAALFFGRIIYFRCTEYKYMDQKAYMCKKHYMEISSPATSEGRCRMCFKRIESGWTPIYALCDACSVRSHKCYKCGEKIK